MKLSLLNICHPHHLFRGKGPSHLAQNGKTRLVVYYTICMGPHHLCGGKEREGARGARQGGPHHLCRGKGRDGSERE